MKITTVLFDLDGTLLPMNQDTFIKAYFGGLAKKMSPHGYEPEKLISAIWSGTKAMIKNTGEKMNESVFWEVFNEALGKDIGEDTKYFDEFYANDFCNVRSSCGYDAKASEAVRSIKDRGFKIALATNPFFPSTATEQRLGWTGLSTDEFELYTTYENSHFCKPNPKYYLEVLEKLGVKAEECLMVGNDVDEDMMAEELGMKVFLITNCLINRYGKDISLYPHGSFDDLMNFIDTL